MAKAKTLADKLLLKPGEAAALWNPPAPNSTVTSSGSWPSRTGSRASG
jgi:hypothetical protein